MKILVLGSGAGAGRTHSSIAVSADGVAWVLLNASPDLGQQLREHPQLLPTSAEAEAPIKAVVLLDAQIDHVAGLLGLRLGPRIDLYATPNVFEELTTALPLVNVLQSYCGVRWHMLPVAGDQLSASFQVEGIAGLRFTASSIAGRVPPYSARSNQPSVGDNLSLTIEDQRDGQRLLYSPSLAGVDEGDVAWLRDADCLLVDGSAWREPAVPLRASDARRKVLMRIDSGHPLLDAGSAQRQRLEAQGIEVAYDGMEIEL